MPFRPRYVRRRGCHLYFSPPSDISNLRRQNAEFAGVAPGEPTPVVLLTPKQGLVWTDRARRACGAAPRSFVAAAARLRPVNQRTLVVLKRPMMGKNI